MMLYKVEQLASRDEFLFIVSQQKYKDGDVAEVIEFGYQSVMQMYAVGIHAYSKYYVVYDNSNNVLTTIELKRDGNLVYFVTNNLTPNKIPALVRTLRQLADDTVAKVDVIFTTTLNTYEGAVAFNKMIGFIVKAINGRFSTWAYEYGRR